MSWAKLDDRLDSHPKFIRAWRRSPAAVGLWTFGLTYSSRHALAGFVPEEALLLLDADPADVDVLVEVGLWEQENGGHRIHDFADFNPTEDLRAKRAEAGRRGGRASGKVRRQKAAGKQARADA